MRTHIFRLVVMQTAMLLVMTACSKPTEPAADPHAGHAHAQAKPATDSHAGNADAEAKPAAKAEAAATGAVDACCPPKTGLPATTAGTDIQKKICKEHDVPLVECGICKPDLLPGLKPGQGMKVRLAAKDSAGIAGVETAVAVLGPVSEGIDCYAELAFNQSKLAQISAPVGGIIQEVLVDLGSKVEEKQPVAKIWSASIAEAVAKAVLSHQTLERERKLRSDRVTSEKDLQQAEAEHRGACQQLRTLGFTEEQIDGFGSKPQEQVLMEVRAPFAGELIERTAVRGALVEMGKPLFALADRSVMWAMVKVPQSAMGQVQIGQSIELRVEGLPGKVFTGKLTWMGAEVDERTRMATVRADVPNPEGLLKSRMFAQVKIVVRTSDTAVLVPATAIQRVDGKSFIFVKLGDDLFDARVVRVGAKCDDKLEILEGLKPEEIVVSNHGYSLKSALLISRLGAGCADD